MSLSALGAEISWGEASHLIDELMRETGSHLFADLVGFETAATQAEFATILHAEWFMNMNRDRDKLPDEIELPMPFTRRPTVEPVTAEERDHAAAYLAAHSAFPN